MDNINDIIFDEFLKRNIPEFANDFIFEITKDKSQYFEVSAKNNKIHIKADNRINAIHGFYCYLKKYCGVQLSWCGNRKIKINSLTFLKENTQSKQNKNTGYI